MKQSLRIKAQLVFSIIAFLYCTSVVWGAKVSQSGNNLNNQAAQPTVASYAVIPARSQEIPIPADGDCLYKSIMVSYLLPVVNDADLFNARLGMLIGGNTIIYKEKTKDDDNKDDNKDDIKIDINQVWDAVQVRQHCLNLRRATLVYSLRQYPFPALVSYMRTHMGIGKKVWGGPQELQTIANRLQATIEEYTPNPDDNNNTLTEPIRIQPKHKKALLTLRIVRDNPTTEEAVDSTKDWQTQLIQEQSVQDAQKRQHYRALLKPIPGFLLEQNNLSLPTFTDNIPKNNQAEKLLHPIDDKGIYRKPKLPKNKVPKQHSIVTKKHLATCRGRQLWQGGMTYIQQGKKLTKGYLIITNDDLLLLFEQQPDFNKALDLTNVSTIDLAEYHAIQAQRKQIVITSSTKEENPVLTLMTKEACDTLLHILRYATKRYYTLTEDSLTPLSRLPQTPPMVPKKWSSRSLEKMRNSAIFKGFGGSIEYKGESQRVTAYITPIATIHLFKGSIYISHGSDHLLNNHICALPLHPTCYTPVKNAPYSFIFNLTLTQAQQLGSSTLTLTIGDSRHDFIGWLYYLHYTKAEKPLGSQNYQAVRCTVSCQGFNDAPYTFYCCVNKLKYYTLAYQGLGKRFHRYFGTPLLKLTTSNKKDNLLHNTEPIDWTATENHHLLLELAKPAPKPLQARKFTKPTDEQVCAFLYEQKTCTFYDDIKNDKQAVRPMCNHLHDYQHPKKTACQQSKDCPHLSRFRQAENQQTFPQIKDQIDRTHELSTGDAGLFAYEANFAKMNPIQLPGQHPYHRLNTPYHPRQGLTQLLVETLRNGYNVSRLPIPKKEHPACQGVRYLTPWEFPLIAKATCFLHHPYHKDLKQPLNTPQVCALLLYTNCTNLCTDFRSSQMKTKEKPANFQKWGCLDKYLMEAILLLDQKEKKYEGTLYSGLCNIRFDVKEKYGFLATYTSTSEKESIANNFSGGGGMLMHITLEMRKRFPHCNVMWLSMFSKEREHLLARSADTGLFTAYQWKGTVTRDRSKIQEVRFTPSLFPPLVVASGKTLDLPAGKLHRYSYIKLGRNATITTAPYNPDTQQGGRLSIYCYGDCVLEEGARIHVNGCGHPGHPNGAGQGNGGGEGGIYCAGGGSYRTRGGIGKCSVDKQQHKALGGNSYDSGRLRIKDTLPLGSAGGTLFFMKVKPKHSLPGAAGGGALAITIDGTLQLGKKSGFQANGQNGSWSTGGAGSGGTLMLVCKGIIEMPDGPTNLLAVLGGQSLGRYSVTRGIGGMGYVHLDYQYSVAPQIKLPHGLVCWLTYWMRQSSIKEQSLLFGWIALFVGDSDECFLDQLSQEIANNPHVSNTLQTLPNSNRVYIDYLYEAGQDAYQQKDKGYEKAIGYYQQAIESINQQPLTNDDPSIITEKGCYLKIAEAYVAQGNYPKAIKAYQKAGQKAKSMEEALAQLEQAQQKEIETDYLTKQGLSLYVLSLKASGSLNDSKANTIANSYPFTHYITAFTGQGLTGSKKNKDDYKDDEKKENKNNDDILQLLNKRIFKYQDSGLSGSLNDSLLPQELKERLRKSRVLLLQGASGAGKSLAGRYMTTQYKGRSKDKKGTWLAVFISLPIIYNGAGLLIKALVEKGLDVLTIHALQQSEGVRILFVLDGFDEIITSYRKHANLPDKVHERFGFDQWPNSKFIISCRSQGITDSDKNQYLGLHPEVHLIPFAQQQIKQYINAFADNKALNIAGWNAAQYTEALAKFPGLTAMTREPFSLGLILNVLPSLNHEKGGNISRAELYEAFTAQWFQRQITKLKANENITIPTATLKQTFQTYCEDLALAMFKSGQQVANAGEEGEVWRTFFTQEKRLSLQSSPLRKVGGGRYMFIHKSYQEYFVASRFIHNLLQLLEHQSPWDIYNFPAVDWNQKIYQAHFNDDAAVVGFMIDRLHDTQKRYNRLQKLLFALIEYSKHNQQVAVLAANSATLLCAARICLGNQKWSGICIPHAKLDEAFLCGTDFSHSDCRGVSLRQAYVERTTWQGAKVHNINFWELPYLQHDGRVNAVAYSPDGRYIASASWDKTVRIWDSQTGYILCIGGMEHAATLSLTGACFAGTIGLSDTNKRLIQQRGGSVEEKDTKNETTTTKGKKDKTCILM